LRCPLWKPGGLDGSVIARMKAQAVKKGGLLEIVETTESLDFIGGLDLLKDWLVKRKKAFSRQAQAYGLPHPKGLLILGIPGTGKKSDGQSHSGHLRFAFD